jgi:hypothetical protein
VTGAERTALRAQPYKRFVLMQYDQYYPGGGTTDVTGSFDTLEEAIEFSKKEHSDYSEVLDMDERKTVWEE